jgi:hypothetical protein
MAMCNEPALNARIAELCFGEAGGEERAALEAHLLVCDDCWTEFQLISEAVHVLRDQKTSLEPVMAADLIQLVGFGARVQGMLGGHRAIAAAIAMGFGAMVSLALLVEVAYQWELYSSWAPYASLGLGLGSAAVCLLSFEAMRARVLAGRSNGIAFALGPILAWAAVAALVVAPFLSAEPIVLANFQTMTARIGWMKSVGQALQIPLLSLIPFHFVLAMQYELWANRVDRILRVLTRDPMAVTPRGSLFIRPAIAAVIFVLFASWWIIGSAHLLENLQPGPYLGLFMTLGILRMMLVLLTLLAVLIWYARALNELKREAIAISAGRKALDTH